jgi:hypothetical protein
MANKKSTKTKVEKVIKEPKIIKEIKETVVKKKRFNDNDLISVMNYTTGECIWINPTTNRQWSWNGFGSILQIPFSEVVVIMGQKPKYFKRPFLIIIDEDVVEYFNLTDFYKLIVKPDEINKFYNLGSLEMVEFLHKTTVDVREIIIRLTKENMKNNIFNDSFKAKLIQSTVNEINKKTNENYFDINLFEVFDEE